MIVAPYSDTRTAIADPNKIAAPGMSRELERLRATWGALGKDDPLWAILSHPGKRGGGWNLDEFFAAGESEIAVLEPYLAHFGLPQQRDRALDFGCGVGRVTRALATRFAAVIGVDVSASMIARARELNARFSNIHFVENPHAHLGFAADASVDLVYSHLTLQHIPPELQATYLAEFMRVLAPDGLAVLQFACGFDSTWRGRLLRALPNRALNPLRRWVHRRRTVFEMHVLAESEVERIIATHGRRVIHIEDIPSAGAGYHGRRFFIAS